MSTNKKTTAQSHQPQQQAGEGQALTWQSLEKWTFDKLQKFLGCPPDEIVSYVFAVESNSDIESYLLELLNNTKQAKSFVEQLLKKINSLPRRVTKKPQGKPSARLIIKQQEQEHQQKQQQKQSQQQKKEKHVLKSFSEIQIDGKPGDPCDCQATKHKLITNCLNCGKVICEQEGRDKPCWFCQTPLFSKIDHSKPINTASSEKESLALTNAIHYKDTILGYQKHGVQRTIVYDDQEDYFSNASNKWISAEERKIISAQEAEYNDKLEREKKANRVQFDFVNGRILAAAPQNVKIDKINLTPASSTLETSTSNTLESLTSNSDQLKGSLHYTTEHLRHVPKKNNNSNNNNNNNNNNKKKEINNNSIVQQYYGVEEDLLVLQSQELGDTNSLMMFRGVMEGLWYKFGEKESRRLPDLPVYTNYLETLSQKNGNYLVIAPDQYDLSSSSLEGQVPDPTIKFVKSLYDVAQTNGVMLNIAIHIPIDFIFSASTSVGIIKRRIERYVSTVGATQFTLVLPSGFNESFTTIPASTEHADYNTAKTYASCQLAMVNQVLQEMTGRVKDILVCPSYFEIDLRRAPSRQQIEYWRELIRGLDTRCSLMISTPSGQCDNYILLKLHNLFEKRRIVIVEKFPYGSTVDRKTCLLDPYSCLFSDTSNKLSGVLASPFQLSFYIDRLSLLIPFTTFIQFLQSPAAYQDELTLRAHLAEMMMNDTLAEGFSDLILALANGVFDKMVVQANSPASIDDRGKHFLSSLITKASNVVQFFRNQPDMVDTLNNIINTLSNFIK